MFSNISNFITGNKHFQLFSLKCQLALFIFQKMPAKCPRPISCSSRQKRCAMRRAASSAQDSSTKRSPSSLRPGPATRQPPSSRDLTDVCPKAASIRKTVSVLSQSAKTPSRNCFHGPCFRRANTNSAPTSPKYPSQILPSTQVRISANLRPSPPAPQTPQGRSHCGDNVQPLSAEVEWLPRKQLQGTRAQ